MRKDKQESELRIVTGTATFLTLLAFLIPVLWFGGRGNEGRENLSEPGAPSQSPAILLPMSAVEEGEWTPLPVVESGERDSARMVRVLEESGEIVEMSMSDYLWGVVAAEMPASFEPEALKAQATAARPLSMPTRRMGSGTDAFAACAQQSPNTPTPQ